MEEGEEKRKSSVEVEMENYLKKELGSGRPELNESIGSVPLDLTVPKKSQGDLELPRICVTQDLTTVQTNQPQTLATSQPSNQNSEQTSDNQPQISNHSANQNSESIQQTVTTTIVTSEVKTKQPSEPVSEAAEIAQTIIHSVLTNSILTPVSVDDIIDTKPSAEEAVGQVLTDKASEPSEGKQQQHSDKVNSLSNEMTAGNTSPPTKPDRVEIKLTPPSRIPSRKNSTGHSLSEDLRNLENRLERYISKTGSEAGSETSEVSDSSARSGASISNVVNRLHNGQTASTRARAARGQPTVASGHPRDGATGHRDLMTSSFRGKLPEPPPPIAAVKVKQNESSQKSSSGSPPDKQSGTASMLKSTLRKMSRFSISGNKGKKDEDPSKKGEEGRRGVEDGRKEGRKGEEEEKKEGRQRSRLVTRPGPLSPPTVNRSRSFKEPERPGRVDSRNQAYTSSLRRPKNKLQTDQDSGSQAAIQRSGTGVERSSSMRRSISASRGGARVVKKSRTVQTQLTKDAGGDMTEDVDGPQGTVHFQVWLPELLGEDTDQVQTHVETSNEPVDVRKNRQLTLENMKLQREVERMKSTSTENESLKKEVKQVKLKLEEEQKTRMSIQRDLESNHERVRGILCGMEAVERELESRGDTVQQLEEELERRRCAEDDLGNQLEKAGQTLQAQKRELDRSMAAQKTLIQQLQESEAEARELQEFMQAEKGTLVEALRELEAEQKRMGGLLAEKEDQSSLLVRRAEQRTQELQTARAELNSLKERAREMLLGQGAELSRASIAVAQLTARIDQLLPEQEEDSSSSSCEQLEVGLPRRSSQFLVTPTENLDILSEFSKAIMSASTGSETMGEGSLSSLATAIADRKHSQNEATTQGGLISVPSLADQINQVDILLSRFISTKESSTPPQTNGYSSNNGHATDTSNGNGTVNGNTITTLDIAENLENLDLGNIDITRKIILEQNKALAQLRSMVEEREESLQEMKGKFLRNRQILNSNWQQAEDEVRKVDQIYQETVGRVVETLTSLPEVVGAHSPLHLLLNSLQNQEEADGINGNTTVSSISSRSLKSKSESILSRSLICDQPSRQSLLNEQTNNLSNSNLMSQSLLIQPGVGESCLRGGGVSEPCLLKSPLGGLPASITRLAGSPARIQEDLNANQSL